MFKKILIANRGEIACRIIKTAKKLGITCVAVYSESDAQAQFVKLADETYFLGPSIAQESYLNQGKILDIAKQANVEAIHPGYGFLAENAEFAAACVQNDICFIGPPVKAIRTMGSKSAAKKIMQQAGIPIVDGYHEEDQQVDFLMEKATQIGYPVLIKAVAGGGGKGMRVVELEKDFKEALEGAKREALKAFGSDEVILEKYLLSPRHIEVQVFADMHGNIVQLFERDCSIQRRNQKIIEETPAPHFSEKLRGQMTDCAVSVARVVNYVGAGTVEFLLDKDQFYFMEMNTRLQVEHAITEKITGIDLVEWQLRIAMGEALPLSQAQISCQGHAIEARIYAEDPSKNFLPGVGTIHFLKSPEESIHIRLDTGIAKGDTISTYYDSMLCKLIAWGETREIAIDHLYQGLMQYQLVGLTTNLDFLKRIVQQPNFIAGNIDTRFVEKYLTQLLSEKAISDVAIMAAAICTASHQEHQAQLQALQTQDPYSPWALYDAWRVNNKASQTFYFLCGENRFEVELIREDAQHFEVILDEKKQVVTATYNDHHLSIEVLHHTYEIDVVFYMGALHLFLDAETVVFKPFVPLASTYEHYHDPHLIAPLPGTVIAIFAKEGDVVEVDERLAVIEAMKMEHTIRAPSKGIVKTWYFKVGDLVSEGAELLSFESIEESL